MFDKPLLLAYYHPITIDLAISFRRLFSSVEIAVIPTLKDNYGGFKEVAAKCEAVGIKCITLASAMHAVKAGKYCLAGCDGVFDGDKFLMQVCEENGIPHFCIMGYPNTVDEPSKNILSFSWFSPQSQYRQIFPNEYLIKEVDWQNLALGKTLGKNICVYYPEMTQLKNWKFSKDAWFNGAFQRSKPVYKFVSFIHRYEECNRWPHKIFHDLKQDGIVHENYSNLSSEEVWDKLLLSEGLMMMKAADCPGIALLESMILERVPVVMKSYLLASHNQEVLIDGYSAIVCDTVEELRKRVSSGEHKAETIRKNVGRHAEMLTNFDRQRSKLIQFFERCGAK